MWTSLGRGNRRDFIGRLQVIRDRTRELGKSTENAYLKRKAFWNQIETYRKENSVIYKNNPS